MGLFVILKGILGLEQRQICVSNVVFFCIPVQDIMKSLKAKFKKNEVRCIWGGQCSGLSVWTL